MITRPHWGAGRVRLAGFVALVFLLTTGFALPAPPGEIEQVTKALGLPDLPATEVPAQAGEDLEGLFRIDPADCGGGSVSGSFFRMIQPGGTAGGPWVENGDSACADKSYTDLAPGRDGGLSTTDYQPHPDPAFGVNGGGTNDRITVPKSFFGTPFATATNATDPQTGQDAAVPRIVHDGAGNLSGNVSAFAAAWNRQHFNQGAPKPDGGNPGLTAGPAGTYDAATGRFTIEWRSTIVGGPFNNFTGLWHFEGVLERAAGAPSGEADSPGEGGGGGGGDGGPLPLPLPLDSGAPRPVAAAPAPARVSAGQVAAGELKGLFRLTPASCATAGQESGSWFRMIQANGNPDTGPFISNTDSTCADRTFTDLSPGKDGGLSTTAFQPHPDPVFDASGNGLNDRITMPKGFFGTKFATATNETDPQTDTKTPLPVIRVDGSGNLSGDLRAFAAGWQSQHFNQGAPKPDGTNPGLTSGPTGTLDPTSRKFTLEWVTTIKSDSGASPFENFSGRWHFEGVYEGPLPTGAPAAPAGDTTPAASATPAAGVPAASTVSGAAGQVAGTGLTPRTGPLWPGIVPASLLLLAVAGRWLSRRPQAPGTPRTPGPVPQEG